MPFVIQCVGEVFDRLDGLEAATKKEEDGEWWTLFEAMLENEDIAKKKFCSAILAAAELLAGCFLVYCNLQQRENFW